MALEKLAAGVVGLSMFAAQVGSTDVADFQKRVANYLKLRKSAVSAVATLKATDSPEKIHDHERDIALAIRAARPNAAQGDIFTPANAAEFRRIIQAALSAP